MNIRPNSTGPASPNSSPPQSRQSQSDHPQDLSNQDSLGESVPQGQKKAWSFLFYNVGQGNLTSMATASLQQLEQVGSDENTHVIALNFRQRPSHQELLHRFTEFEGARSYYVTSHPKASAQAWLGPQVGSLADCALASPDKIRSRQLPLEPLSAADMSNPDTLKKFLMDNIRRFPSEHIALAITGHGAAFQGQAITRGPEGRAALSNEAIASVLNQVAEETGQKVDVVNLNTCYSANLESLYALKDATQVIVASEDALAVGTQPFSEVIREVQNRQSAGQSVDARDLAKIFVNKSQEQPLHQLHTPTLTALDAPKLAQVGESLANFQELCLKENVSPAQLRECLAVAVQIDFSHEPREVRLTDLGSLMKVVEEKIANPKLQAAAQAVALSLTRSVLAEQHSTSDDENWISKSVRRIPFLVGQQKDLGGATGLTVFWDPQEKHRLELISQGSYGQHYAQAFSAFMDFLSQT